MLKLLMVQIGIIPAWVVAQDVSDTGTASIATLVVQLGLSGVFLYLYQQERKERIRVTEQAFNIAQTAYPILPTLIKSMENMDQAAKDLIYAAQALKK